MFEAEDKSSTVTSRELNGIGKSTPHYPGQCKNAGVLYVANFATAMPALAMDRRSC